MNCLGMITQVEVLSSFIASISQEDAQLVHTSCRIRDTVIFLRFENWFFGVPGKRFGQWLRIPDRKNNLMDLDFPPILTMPSSFSHLIILIERDGQTDRLINGQINIFLLYGMAS